MKFSELGLSQKVLDAVTASGYTQPTPIQAQAIPHVLARRDVLGIAQTGTGKTAAFTLPMLTLLEQGRARARMPRTLILEPTRELAAQVEESFDRYGEHQQADRGAPHRRRLLRRPGREDHRGVDVLIATPGRLLDHFERGKLLLTGVEILVIDEADRMLDMGFIPDIERICKLVPFTRQTLFFSATMPPEIQRLTETFLHNPVADRGRAPGDARPRPSRSASSPPAATPHAKRDVLRDLIRDTRRLQERHHLLQPQARRPACSTSRLSATASTSAALHGDLDQRARMAALDGFRNGRSSCWWPATWPRAASTSRTSATSSTSTCRTMPRTTSTASAAPAAPARRAPRSRW